MRLVAAVLLVQVYLSMCISFTLRLLHPESQDPYVHSEMLNVFWYIDMFHVLVTKTTVMQSYLLFAIKRLSIKAGRKLCRYAHHRSNCTCSHESDFSHVVTSH